MTATLRDFNIAVEQPCDTELQSALNQVATDGGGVLEIPTGKYIVEGTIALPPAVEIRSPIGNRAKVAEILHKPKLPDTDLFTCQVDIPYKYNYMGKISGLCLAGDKQKSRRGFDLFKPSGLIFDSVVIEDFHNPMRLQSGIQCKFDMCFFSASDLPGKDCVVVEFGPRREFEATTYEFASCRFYQGDWCMRMHHSSVRSTCFRSCIFESSYKGVADIHTGNYGLIFDGSHIENTGRLGDGTPAFKLGKSGPPGFDGGVTAFFQHGTIMASANGEKTRVLFDCDYTRRLVARDMIVYRNFFGAGHIKTTGNTGQVTLENVEK